jgi:hypothetical protein
MMITPCLSFQLKERFSFPHQLTSVRTVTDFIYVFTSDFRRSVDRAHPPPRVWPSPRRLAPRPPARRARTASSWWSAAGKLLRRRVRDEKLKRYCTNISVHGRLMHGTINGEVCMKEIMRAVSSAVALPAGAGGGGGGDMPRPPRPSRPPFFSLRYWLSRLHVTAKVDFSRAGARPATPPAPCLSAPIPQLTRAQQRNVSSKLNTFPPPLATSCSLLLYNFLLPSRMGDWPLPFNSACQGKRQVARTGPGPGRGGEATRVLVAWHETRDGAGGGPRGMGMPESDGSGRGRAARWRWRWRRDRTGRGRVPPSRERPPSGGKAW